MSAASAAAAAAAAASTSYKSSNSNRGSNQAPDHRWVPFYTPSSPQQPVLNRYETQKRNDWNAFRQHLKKRHPSLILSRCTGVIVIEFLDDQFGNTKTHTRNCPFFENPDSPGSCSCPLMQGWSSLDGLVSRLRVAFEENGGRSGNNPFSAGVVRVYLSQVKDAQANTR